MATTPETVRSADGTTIAFRRLGTGPAIVVLHGGVADSASWLSVARLLADRFELFLVDRRGRGESGPGGEPHSIGREVDDAVAVLERAGPGAVLLGHSYGGAVALETALAAPPAALARLILYEPAVAVGGLIPPAALQRMRAFVAGGEPERCIALAIERLSAAGLVHSSGDTPAARRRDRALAPLAWTVPRELEAADTLGAEPDRYAAITTPTMVMMGTASPGRQQAGCQALAAALPNGELERFDGHGHVAHNTAPELVAAAIRRFLAERRQAVAVLRRGRSA